MKYSETRFSIPVKIYDGKSIREIFKKRAESESEEDDEEIEPSWVQGVIKINYYELDNLYWFDTFSSDRDVKEVSQNGFDLTGIFHPVFGEFECLWKMSRFEKELDAFVEKYEADPDKPESPRENK